MNRETVWLAIGFLRQGLFFMRFFVQWLASERKGKSHIPISFWYFSLGGSMILLTYAIYRRDPVFICGQLFGILVYVRNLQLIDRVKAHAEAKS
jgi:lipid-A-disaccharide synthase-like uncharacterized protein